MSTYDAHSAANLWSKEPQTLVSAGRFALRMAFATKQIIYY